ncbi:MAG: mechanosensitive ion channel family protein [Nanoarchaeota archaeon]|nr:mechanosensitive ion channel family protein [Nanoarchaeota archaeon]
MPLNAVAQSILSNKYLVALATLVIFFVIAKIAYKIFTKYLSKLAAKTKTTFDDKLIKQSEVPVALLILFFGTKLAILPLKLAPAITSGLQKTFSSITVIITSFIIVIFLDLVIEHWGKRLTAATDSKADDQILSLGHKASRFITIIVAGMFILQIWGVEVGPLLASIGVLGVAIAFGLQKTLGNIFGGISIIADRSVRVGDVIKIGTDTYGEVIDIGLRATRIRTWDNEVKIIPNGELANEVILNYVLPNPKARIIIPFSVAYGNNINKIKKIVLEKISKLKNLDKENEPKVMFLEMAESSLNFKAYVWITSYKDRFSTKEDLNCKIYDTLNKNKIKIPFPQVDVHLDPVKKK